MLTLHHYLILDMCCTSASLNMMLCPRVIVCFIPIENLFCYSVFWHIDKMVPQPNNFTPRSYFTGLPSHVSLNSKAWGKRIYSQKTSYGSILNGVRWTFEWPLPMYSISLSLRTCISSGSLCLLCFYAPWAGVSDRIQNGETSRWTSSWYIILQ